MKPKHIALAAKHAVGIRVRTTNALEANPATSRLSELWKRFYSEDVQAIIRHQTQPPTVLGVYTNYESDASGEYDVVAACETSSLSDVPDGMTGVEILAGEYLVFFGKGEMPQVVVETWGAVWRYFENSTDYRRTFTTDFEHYKSADACDIYIAVKSALHHRET